MYKDQRYTKGRPESGRVWTRTQGGFVSKPPMSYPYPEQPRYRRGPNVLGCAVLLFVVVVVVLAIMANWGADWSILFAGM